MTERMGTTRLTYVCDNKRHLICVPYSIENLHKMAQELNIKRHWFHKNHYDIPVKRMNEIQKRCKVIDTKEIVEIIRSPEYGEIIVGEEVQLRGASPSDHFQQKEMEYNGFSKER